MSDKTGPKVHELKCHPEPFAALKSGAKTFEWRKDDRGYQVGDTLWLREWMPTNGSEAQMGDTPSYTGQFEERTVTYIIREGFGIPEGYCIMGLAAGAASKEPERDSAWIIEGCRKAWKEGGFEDKDRADERFRTKYQAWACGWHEGRARLIGKDHSTRYGHCSGCEPNGTTHQEGTIEHPADPDAHLTGEDYLEAKQKRCAVWMKGQSAEEIEREMRGEPSKAILLPMSEQDIERMADEQGYSLFTSEQEKKLGENLAVKRGRNRFAFTHALRCANTKAVSIEAIKSEVYQWRARHFNNPKEQADDLDSRLNNLTK